MSRNLQMAILNIVALCCCSTLAMAQEKQTPPPNVVGQNLAVVNPLTSFQMWSCILCVLIGIIVFSGQFYLLRRASNINADDIVKNCTITLVVIGALILIVAGYSSQQTAQAFGLFGTVIGYLLGKSAGKGEGKQDASGGN